VISKLKQVSYADIYVLIFVIGIMLAPLQVNSDQLPRGWELEKVFFLQFLALLLLCLSGVRLLYLLIKRKLPRPEINYWLLVFILTLVISTLLSLEYRAVADNDYSSIINKVLAMGGGLFDKTAIYGSATREAGLVTYVLLGSMLVGLYQNLNQRRIKLLQISFILSSLHQVFMAFSQFNDLFPESAQMITEGRWVFGTFGQANFYVGYVLMGLVFTMQLLRTQSIGLKAFALLLIVIQSLGIVISYSLWGITAGLLLFVLIIGYELLQVKYFTYLLLLPTFIGLLLFTPTAFFFVRFLPEGYKFRIQIWGSIYDAYVRVLLTEFSFTHLGKILFGSGLDTLGENISIAGVYVDRAHNFLLDIFSSVGMFGLALFLRPWYLILKKLKSIMFEPTASYVLIAALLWMIRSLIHTSSILNILQFTTLLTVLLYFVQQDQYIQKQAGETSLLKSQ
jgi:O-antigen ligase